MFTKAEQPTWLHCGAVCGGDDREGTMPLAYLSSGFQSLPLLPTSKVGFSDADYWVGGFAGVLGPFGVPLMDSPMRLEFLLPPNPHRGFEALFPHVSTLGFSGSKVYLPMPLCWLELYNFFLILIRNKLLSSLSSI